MSTDGVAQAFRSAPGEGETLPLVGRVRVSAAQSAGSLEVIELEGAASPPPHVHHEHDECFSITEGVFSFTLGTEEVEAPAGSVVFVPRGTRHAFKHSEGARALVFVIPAADLEGFFRELGGGLLAGRAEADIRAALSGRYDSEPVG